MSLPRIRQDRTLAYVVPLVAFMLIGGGLSLLTGFFDGFFYEHENNPWWQSYPEHWIYPLQTLLGGGLLLSGGGITS